MFWAFLLLLLGIMLAWCCYGQPAPPRPMLVVPPPETNWVYLAATAVDDYTLESDYSNEAKVPYIGLPVTIIVAWDKSPGTNRIVNYKVYYGDASRSYTNSVSAGTNLTVKVIVRELPRPPTIIMVSATNAPSFVITNPGNNVLLFRTRSWKVTSTKWPTVLEAKTVNPPSEWATLSGPVTNTSRPTVILTVQRLSP